VGLIDEIREQPEVVARLLEQAAPEVESFCEVVRRADPSHVVIAARGTSDHAAIYAQYALGVLAGLNVGLATPSVHSLYGAAPDYGRALVVGISQSGASPDVVGVIRAARAQGALTLAITNTPGSDMATAAAHHLDLRAGPERAVAATKTYTATLTVLAMLTAGLAGGGAGDDLRRLPGAVATMLAQEGEARRIAADQVGLDRCVVLGRGYHYATAREWSLKLKELAYVLADPYSSADFIHGPLALIEAGFPILAVAPRGATSGDLEAVIERLGDELQARLLILSDDPTLRATGHWAMALPDDLPEWLMPIAAIVPGQLHAVHLTMAKGRDPEQPRSIRKVTLTN
jgi:glucosamine--fructose-6-phosphate aminotransferase (isomerizing)